MVAGIYGDISLQAFSDVRIDYVVTEQKHEKDACTVTVFVECLAAREGSLELQVTIWAGGAPLGQSPEEGLQQAGGRGDDRGPEAVVAQRLRASTPLRPHRASGRRRGLQAHRASQPRARQPEDAHGLSMVFRVNGQDIFCKGANWIPHDALPQRESRQRLEHLLSSAARAHMNMIRVWGGGKYESDDFYSLCDEKGILLWQDMMFSCALYPATRDFLSSVGGGDTPPGETASRPSLHCPMVREQRGCWRTDVVSRIAAEPGSLHRGLRQAERGDHRKDRGRMRPHADFLAELTLRGSGGLLGQLARRQARRHALLERLARRETVQRVSRGDSRASARSSAFSLFRPLDAVRMYAAPKDFNVTSPVMEHHQRHPARQLHHHGDVHALFPHAPGIRKLRVPQPGPAGTRHPHRGGALEDACGPRAWGRCTGSSTTTGRSAPGHPSTTRERGSSSITRQRGSSPPSSFRER